MALAKNAIGVASGEPGEARGRISAASGEPDEARGRIGAANPRQMKFHQTKFGQISYESGHIRIYVPLMEQSDWTISV